MAAPIWSTFKQAFHGTTEAEKEFTRKMKYLISYNFYKETISHLDQFHLGTHSPLIPSEPCSVPHKLTDYSTTSWPDTLKHTQPAPTT